MTQELTEDQIIEAATNKQMGIEAGVTLEEPVIETIETTQETTEETQPDEAPEPSINDIIKELREDNARLRKTVDKTNGTYGNELQKLRTQLDTFSKSKPSQIKLDGLNIDNPAFAKIKEDYPELGQAIVDGMRQALTIEDLQQEEEKEATTKVEDSEEPAKTFDPFNVELAMRELRKDHPDFETVARFSVKQIAPGLNKVEWKDKNFGEFVEALEDDERNVVMHGESPQEILKISEIISKYKQHSETSQTQKESPVVDTTIKPDLRKAVLPTGKAPASTALTEDEIIKAAINREMKRYAGLT